MSLNSVNTNVGAMIALESLNRTNSDLAATQKRVSTGYRVPDSTDDGAAYAVAQSVRSVVGGLTTANQQLGNVQGLLSTTQSGLNDISNTMASMRDVLVSLSDGNASTTTRAQYQTQYKSLLANIKTFLQDSNYGGKSLIGNFATDPYKATAVNVVRNEAGATYGIVSYNGSGLYASLALLSAASTAVAIAALTKGGNFISHSDTVGTQLNTVGSEITYVSNQIKFNSNRIDALNQGLGALVDADLAKESAQLQSLQIRQQLGTQALSLANQAPQTLLSLFK